MSDYQRPASGKVEPGCTYVRPGTKPKEAVPAPNRQRVEFFKDGVATPETSLWAEVVEDGIVLEHDYHGFNPVGMTLSIGGRVLKRDGRRLVTAVEG